MEAIQDNVVNEARIYGGALPKSELLRDYNIRGPFEDEKLDILREER